jgi:hypothetical protein
MDESSPFINFDRDKSPEEIKMKEGKVFAL